MSFTAADVKKLRDATNAGMLDCKNALTETNGDFEAAIDLLRKKGIAKAAKRAGRAASNGKVVAWVNAKNDAGFVVEVNCETDFVARGDIYNAYVDKLVGVIAANPPATLDELLAMPFDEHGPVKDGLTNVIAQTGENMQIRRYCFFKLVGAGYIHNYIHLGGKIGVLVELSFGKTETAANEAIKTLANDLALQIAAMNPVAVRETDIPADVVERERAIYMDQAAQSGKPANVLENIVKGKFQKWYQEVVLMKQEFFKDTENQRSVETLVKEVSKSVGDEIKVVRFARFALGEELPGEAE